MPYKNQFLSYQIRLFFTALMFYTRIPCPAWVDHSEEFLNRSTRYFPLVGWIIGGASALVFWGMVQLWSPVVALLGSLFITIWLTGAFHEDGLADVCDGFGGGWTKERVLEIMKDSRLGTFGAAGLFLAVSMKIAALYELWTKVPLFTFLLIMVAGHTLSRWISVTIIFAEEYARGDATSKVKPIAQKITEKEMTVATVFGLLPVLGLVFFKPLWFTLLALGIVWLTRIYLIYIFRKKLGGYTGDCLGAAQQISEVVFYLVFSAMCKLM